MKEIKRVDLDSLIACEQALRGALAAGRKKEGELMQLRLWNFNSTSLISANQGEEKTSWNVNKHWKIRESTRQLQGSFLMSSPPITISLDFFNTEIQLPETYLQALLPFLASPPEPPYFKIVFRETFEIVCLHTR